MKVYHSGQMHRLSYTICHVYRRFVIFTDDFCDGNEFNCGGALCISGNAVCNGYNDCGNLEDEDACGK